MHTVQVTPIIGLPQFNGWSQVTTNLSGSLVCVFAVSGLNAGNVGRDLVEAVQTANPQSAADVHTLVDEWVSEVSRKDCQLQLSSALFKPEFSVFAAHHGHLILKRNQKVGTLLSSNSEVKIIQGSNHPEDVFVLATAQAMTFLGEVQQKLTQGYDLDTIVTSVVPALHGVEDSSLSALGFVTHYQAPAVSIEPELGVADPELNQIPSVAASTTDQWGSSVMSTEPAVEPILHLPPPSSKAPGFKLSPQTLKGLGTTLEKVKVRAGTIFRVGRRLVWGLPKFLPSVGSKDVYVTSTSRKKVIRVILVVLVIASLVMAGGWWWRRQRQLQVQAVEAATEPLLQRVKTAESQVEANPTQARNDAEKALQELEALQPQFANNSAAKKRLEERLTSARATYQSLSGREELKDLPIFYDFHLIDASFIATQADVSGKDGVFLDSGKKDALILDMTSKQVRRVALGELSRVVDMTLSEEKLVILGQGLHTVDLSQSELTRKTIKEEGDSNREGVFVGHFGSYVYVFNPAKRNIFRYAPETGKDTYTDPIGWLKPGTAVVYDQINSWSIDGDIWLGTKDGKIIKLASGELSPFEIVGLPEAFTSPVHIYTRENLEYLYILDPSAQRVVILRKNGEFIRQLKSPSLASATTLIVSEEQKKIWVTSGSLIFEMGL